MSVGPDWFYFDALFEPIFGLIVLFKLQVGASQIKGTSCVLLVQFIRLFIAVQGTLVSHRLLFIQDYSFMIPEI
jgi:hypothetical protein